MNRREAVSRVALLVGGTIVGAEFFLTGCKPSGPRIATLDFTKEDIAYLDEIAETIIPTTDSPGAKAAAVGTFMTVMVKDSYTEQDQKIFLDGMTKVNEASEKQHKKSFMDLTPEQRKAVLTEIDKEQNEYVKTKKEKDKDKKKDEPKEPNHYFTLMKQLTLLGYFTSKIGATEALRYNAVPGRYDGNLPYKKGDKAWAT